MNECDLYQQLISRLVDGELNKNEYAALKEHMENCNECSAMYAVFASLSDIIGSEDEPLPEDLHENIMASVRRHAIINNNKRRLSKPMRNTLAAAACAALVLFAARGLSPAQKAQDAVLDASQAAAMDAAIHTEAVEESLPAPAAVVEQAAPAASQTPAPTATPVPTKDVYLGSGEDKEQTSQTKNNSNNKANTSTKDAGGTVYITASPQEIVVSTPKPTPKATPKPTPKPTPTPAPTVAPTPSPVPTVAATVAPTASPVPTVTATAQPEAAPAALEAETEKESPVPASPEAATPASAAPAATASPEPSTAVTETPAETETPSLPKRFMAFFMPRPAAEPEEAELNAEEEKPLSDEAAVVPEPVAAEEDGSLEADSEAEEEILIKLLALETLTELEDMVDGEEAELPEDEADASYSFCMNEPDELAKDYKLTVHIYGDIVYYEQFFSEEESIACLAKCSVEDFEKFLDSLSDEEKAPLLVSPSPSPAAEQTVSPSPSAEATEAEK